MTIGYSGDSFSSYNAGGANSFGGSTTPTPVQMPAGGGGGGISAPMGGSRSVSSSFIPNYQEEAFLNAIAQHAGAVGDQVYNWAQKAYNDTTANSNANIANFYGVANKALNNAQTYENTYEQNAIPGIRQQFADARNYASPTRIASDMGRAEATAANAGAANHANTVRDLQSFGLNTGDPSSGRYAALDKAEAVQNAASEVQNATTARDQDITRGENLLNNAITNSQPLLGAAGAALNTGTQNFTAAENAALGNANVGAALQQTANPYFQTASSLKYPPLGNASASASQSYPPQSGGGGGGGGSKSPQQSAPRDPGEQTQTNMAPTGGGGGGGGGGYYNPGGGPQGPIAPDPGLGDPGSDPYAPGGDLYGYSGDPFSGGGGTDPYAPGGDLYGYSGDPFSSSAPVDTSSASSDYYSGDYSGDFTGGSDSTSAMARGGAVGEYAGGGGIPDGPTTGGHVPTSASPSHGQRTDDVRANLNADEFVIPRDVANWKGQEFFQKLIMQARKARAMAPAHPQPGPTQPGPTTFASRPMR